MAKRRYTKTTQESELYLKSLSVKSDSQEFYLSMLREMTVTLCTGPAGTGKTYLAAYVALEQLLNRNVDKIVLTRPIVACEDIGYLPGDMHEKIQPYLMPLFDAVEAHVGPTRTKELFADGRLEVLPLAYMRGRSINRACIILDEAQNATQEQMKMMLTRLGYDSKIIINGDDSQSDLPKSNVNGLRWAVDRLRGCDESVAVVEFSSRNIVRHPLIATILSRLDA